MPQALTNMMAPVLALVIWTLVVLVWLYVRRIPAMRKAGIDPAKIKGSESFASLPPMAPKAVWVADNYNHLHEQPTIFYALMFFAALTGGGDALAMNLGWAYVAARIVHSLVQATVNRVMVRFVVFVAGSLVLMALAGKELARVFAG